MSDNKRKKSKRRIEELIQRELGRVLLTYPKESVINKVSITGVDVAPDLTSAKVFFSVFNDSDITSAKKALDGEAKSLRKTLARTVNLRSTPRFDFIYDESIKRGLEISDLIDSAVARDENV